MFRITPVITPLSVYFVLEKCVDCPLQAWQYIGRFSQVSEATLWLEVESIYQKVSDRDNHV